MPITTFPTHVSRTCAVWLRCAIKLIVCYMSMQARRGCTNIALQHFYSLHKDSKSKQAPLPKMSILSPANKPLQSCGNRVTSLQNIQNRGSKNLEVQMGGNYNNMILWRISLFVFWTSASPVVPPRAQRNLNDERRDAVPRMTLPTCLSRSGLYIFHTLTCSTLHLQEKRRWKEKLKPAMWTSREATNSFHPSK